MNCKKCGNELSENAKFCTNCGEPVEIPDSAGSSTEFDKQPAVDLSENSEAQNASSSEYAQEKTDSVQEINASIEQQTSEAVIPAQEKPEADSVVELNKEEGSASNIVQELPGMSVEQPSQDGFNRSAQESSQNSNTGYSYSQPPETAAVDMFSAQQPPKKKGGFKLIAGGIAAVLAVVVLLMAFNASAMTNFFKRTFSSPKDYYKYVTEKRIKSSSASLAKIYDSNIAEAKKNLNCKYESEVKLEVGESLISTLGLISGGQDFSWLESLSCKINGSVKDKAQSAAIQYFLNDKELIAADCFIDGESMFVGLPDISDEYLYLDLTDNAVYGSALQNIIKGEKDYDALPQGKDIEKILNKYSLMLLDSVSDVKKSSEKLSVGNISQNTTKLEATVRGEDYAEAVKKIAGSAKNDEDVKKIVTALYDSMVTLNPSVMMAKNREDFYKQFQNYLDKLEDEIDGQDLEDSSVKITIWVDDKGKIVGSESEALNNGEGNLSYGYKMPFKGDKFGYEFNISNDKGTLAALDGEGKYTSGKLSGNFTLSVNTSSFGFSGGYSGIYGGDGEDEEEKLEAVADINLKSFDVKALEKGKYDVEFELTPAEDSSILQNAPMLGSVQLNFLLKGDDFKLEVLEGENSYFTLTTNIKTTPNGETVEMPDEGIDMTDNEALEEWTKEADWDNLFDKLRETDIPEEWIEAMESSINYSLN